VKLGCSSASYDQALRDGQLDLHAWLRICANDLEVDGVEFVDRHLPTVDPVYLRDLKKLCTELHLTVAGLAVTNDFGADDRRQLESTRVRGWCDVAGYLGAPVVRVFAGRVPRQSPPADDGRIVGLLRRVFGAARPDERRLWSDVAAVLRTCADHAAERAVVLALQNSRADGIITTAWQLEQCMRAVGSPWMRVCLDPADLGERTSIEMVLPYVVQVHARMGEVREDGADAHIHWPGLLQVLKLGRYRGFVLLDYQGVEDATTAVPRAALYMRGLLQLLGRQRLLQQADGDVDGAAANVLERDSEEERIEIFRARSIETETRVST
jgi:sugar phosphate isomerase/epimerase